MVQHVRKRFGATPRENAPVPRIDAIKIAVARDANIPVFRMTDRSRKWRFSHPRQVAIYLACELTYHSYPAIARMFGGLDHTTALHAHRAVRGRMMASSDYEAHIMRLERELLEQASERLDVGASQTIHSEIAA